MLSAACGLAALAVYLWTLQPGPGGPEDSPKFQCLGYALGTAHPPGYPLYTILTHLVSYFPVYSIAWRANAFSALGGAVSVAFVWAAARQLGASRIAATGAAFGLCFTAYFWWNAILAEVYTLGTALEAAVLFFLLRWQRTRRMGDLHAAVGAAAFALGNHLTILALAPACVVFALAVNWRETLRPRTVAINLLLGVAGVATYSYILIRTWMGGALLESRARNLPELFAIMRASRFSGSVGFTASELFTHRFPHMLGELQGQVTPIGLILAAAGLAFLIVRNWRAATLLGFGLLGALLLAADVAADVKGFLMPALVLTWLLSAMGFDTMERAVTALAGRRTALVATAGVAAFVPGRLLATNYESHNLRHNTFESRYLSALFDRLPPGAALLAENYVVNSLVTCQAVVSGRTSHDLLQVIAPSGAAIRAMKSAGHEVFAFEDGAHAAMMAKYRVLPVVLPDTSLRARLDALPPRAVIVIAAAQHNLPTELAPRGGPEVRAWVDARRRSHHVIVLAPRGWESAESTSTDDAIDRRFPAGSVVAGAGPLAADVHVAVDGDRAAISVRRRQVASVYDGVAVVAVGPDGAVAGSWTYASGAPLTVPLEMARWPLYQVDGERHCRAVGDGQWHDVSEVSNEGAMFVRFDNARPAIARLTLYVAAEHEPAPVVRSRFGSPSPTMTHRMFDLSQPGEASALAAVLHEDGVRLDPAMRDARFVSRDDVAVADRGRQAVANVYLGGRPSRVLARGRTDRMTAPRVLVCEESIPPVITSPAALRSTLSLGASTPFYFGAGWRRAEPTPDVSAPHRWTARSTARLVVPVEAPVAAQLQLHVRPAPGVTRVEAGLNGHSLGSRTLSTDWQDVSWDVDVSMWRSGLNELSLVTDRIYEPAVAGRDDRVRGIDVARIVFVRRSQP